MRGKPDPYLTVTESNDRSQLGDSEYVWALKNISFEVSKGKVLGIIGRNGAGKSTLLKILSRVTGPTTGQIKVKGRIASLLEVGTGFHPELTGRENVYLNGAINGMTKSEVTRKLDEIVSFSGCERYIDTPVKRYSSGMKVRLGFAVAAHLDPEILIVDEVLAVGDAEFQKQCIGKMKDVAGEGRTVLFVSHNMAAVRNLCDECMIISNGSVEGIFTTEEAVLRYLGTRDEKKPVIEWKNDSGADGQFLSLKVTDNDHKIRENYECDEPIRVEFKYRLNKPSPSHYLTMQILTENGSVVLFSDIRDNSGHSSNIVALGDNNISVQIPKGLLAPGTYAIKLGSADKEARKLVHQPDELCFFSLEDLKSRRAKRPGVLRLLLPWEISPSPSSENAENVTYSN
ncbi:ABC transporter ATP-binding protein [Rubellicoccus peritrichatus]|uniref:ABC transporter ATP-binding protein n=1 Tax=Rubellicoccus peritrichatus TaxID=3080537 RepID=A0AAQ3LBE1_9BACT|nr:ABC transporter ATP-binding protein [Puniceicoccus sp. CR14]WOO41424.1 ABC transporter ATP-binding protein [Puniceicoccus sp. CR14]